VEAGMDTIIEPFVQLLGRTRIGENCRVGACSILLNARIDDEVLIAPFTMVESAVVARAARLGPYSRVRPGSEVGPSAHIGNFVELKNAQVGAGAKANHLAYLGDCSIGSKTNVGAGTITCNYDGVKKHRTEIAEGVFVGSNSTLVAPLNVESGAYIAAGSVITEDVPGDALALGRARQVVKPDWVKRRHNEPRQP
jgi:bifunctional UDP-N-acetylglucosamine pyrophosphorylase/glucosamine-1-phosphate N-acetyltransferase